MIQNHNLNLNFYKIKNKDKNKILIIKDNSKKKLSFEIEKLRKKDNKKNII